MADVFVSYARENREIAQHLAEGLQQRGWSVWWDRELIPGESYDEVIERELTHAGAVIVIWSEHSTRSPWVRSEANAALNRGTFIPVLADAATPPLRFQLVESVDLSVWDGSTAHPGFRRLLRGVDALVEIPTAPAPAPLPPPPPEDIPSPPDAAPPPPPPPESRSESSVDVENTALSAPAIGDQEPGTSPPDAIVPEPPPRRERWRIPIVAGAAVAVLALVLVFARPGGFGGGGDDTVDAFRTTGALSPETAAPPPSDATSAPDATSVPSTASPHAETRVPLQNASFEAEGGWRAVYKADAVAFGITSDPATAHSGDTYGRFASNEHLGSVAQDVELPVEPGDTTVFTIWVRAGTPNARVRPGVWLFNGLSTDPQIEPPHDREVRIFPVFEATDEWKQVTFELLATREHSHARVEVYAEDAGTVYLDDAELTATSS